MEWIALGLFLWFVPGYIGAGWARGDFNPYPEPGLEAIVFVLGPLGMFAAGLIVWGDWEWSQPFRRNRNGEDGRGNDSAQDPAASGGSGSGGPYAGFSTSLSAGTNAIGTSSGMNYSSLVQQAYLRSVLGLPTTPARAPAKVIAQDAPVYGWRNYGLGPDGKLQGSRATWDSREFVAECASGNANEIPEAAVLLALSNDREAFDVWKRNRATKPNPAREACLNHLEHGNCPEDFGCGIWGRANPEPGLIMAHCIAWGTVATDDEGNWRASDVRIEALYVNKAMYESWLHAAHYGLPTYLPYIDFDRIAADLYAKYGVPVKVIEDPSEINAV